LKKIMMGLGVIFLFLIITAGAGFAYLAKYVGPRLDASSKEYVNENIPKFISTWNENELMSRASSELIAILKPGDIEKFLVMYSKLGKLKSYAGCNGEANIQLNIGSPNVITASYIANAEFEKGPATIQVQLIQKEGKWEILSLYINSPVFMQ
jgi:hypothetical protein